MTLDRATVSCEQVWREPKRFHTFVDVRSEGEFAEDHLPGAINLPVLHDAERAAVGTLYKQVSPFEARRRGATLVARNIASIIDGALVGMGRDWKPLVYCWRGGQRSAALTHVLTRIGWPARQLEGGYRAFRRHVVQELMALPTSFNFVVVCGPTGSGKSRLLQQLALAGAQVLDLEQLAHHRGSVLGGLPSQPQPSQKMFDTRIWSTLRGLQADLPVFVESESRKVGDLRVPDALIAAMRASACVRIDLPVAERVKLLRDEYVHFERDPAQLLSHLDCLLALHGHDRVEQWKKLATASHWDTLVERLLREHYDPSYLRSIDRNFAHVDAARVVALERSTPEAFAAAAQTLAASRF